MTMKSKNTRGIRNNNPLNIRFTRPHLWLGQTEGTDKEFCTFRSMEWGLRAGLYLLTKYHSQYGLHTVKAIISRWAPPSDGNDTASYIREVTNNMGGNFEMPRNMYSLYLLARGMCRVESGYVLDEETFCKAYCQLPEKMQKYWQGND